MITVTADTNIYISGFQFGGIPLAFLDYARAGAFRLAVSEPLLAEVGEVLTLKFAWSKIEVEAALAQLEAFLRVSIRPSCWMSSPMIPTTTAFLNARSRHAANSSSLETSTCCVLPPFVASAL